MSRTRLDDELLRRGIYKTRSKARDAVNRGTIFVDGLAAVKPAQNVSERSNIEARDPALVYVSRAALKLEAGLEAFGINPRELNCLDIGASTGGFTDVLLRRGAAHVTAIDVGQGQMHPRIAGDPHVTVIEELNARDLTQAHLAHPIDLIVCDVSFISLKLALPNALAFTKPSAWLIALIKPQFEVGKAGNAKDAAQQDAVCRDIEEFLSGSGWCVVGSVPSPISGGEGQKEFLIGAAKA